MAKQPCLQDFDSRPIFESCCARARKPDCQGLVIDFDTETASCALNPTLEVVQNLLEQRAKTQLPNSCLWLNLWGWSSDHETIIRAVAEHYSLSPRLAQSLCPRQPATGRRSIAAPLDTDRYPFEEGKDIENATNADGVSSAILYPQINQSASFADVFNALWHFCTVDFGHRYICIGWNALFFLPHTKMSNSGSKPNAIRIWSSLLLCDDGTVVAVFERPNDADPLTISRIRDHQLNVLQSLSRASDLAGDRQHNLLYTAIRATQVTRGSQAESITEMASLLFYYLFDDWLNLFQQVSGSKHSYRYQLELMRGELMEHPREEQINTLHQLGRQLNSLRSICRSYQSIIEQILRKQVILTSRARRKPRIDSMRSLEKTLSISDEQLPYPAAKDDSSEEVVPLHLSSIARFERLHDRIDLCATNEIDECVKEKEALVQMNFNLISLKEAQTVERLTRTTILLAKVTILFLPLSLATGYFSMQLRDIELTPLKTYWLTFLIVAVATIAFLAIFEFFSGRYSGKLSYRPIIKVFFERRRKNVHR